MTQVLSVLRGLATIALVAFATMVLPTAASAVTIGSLASTDPGPRCESVGEPFFIAQVASSIPYSVPAGGGIVTSWSTSFGEPGAQLSLIFVRPTSTPKAFAVVGSDTETLPSPIPANHVSTFTPASPILVQEGDILGLQMPDKSKAACVYEGSSTDKVAIGAAGGLEPGSTLKEASITENVLTNASATITQSVDLGLSEAITPPSGPPGVAVLSLTATDAGPAAVPATISDVVPSGLRILAAGVSSGGECTIAGQAVTCGLLSVPTSGTPPVADIVVSSSTPGSYSNQAQITSALTDSAPANNTASATLVVTAPVAPSGPSCEVVNLVGAPLAVAKTVLAELHCAVGKITHATSKTVAKGLVIKTTPKATATVPAGTVVGITVSTGKPRRKKHAARHKSHH